MVLGVLLGTIPSCRRETVIEDPSPFALESGQSTLLLGSDCSRPMALGYDSCPLRDGEKMPNLRLAFFNAADYAVSDCYLGIHQTGSVSEPGGVVDVDLSGLTEQVQKQKFCLLRIEAIERYPDPKDPNQLRQIPFAGGFFVEVLDKNYFPEPSDSVVSWCFKVSGTNKGRRKIERCK
jgi:hypothetical protein